MLERTQTRTKYIFAAVLLLVIGYTVYYAFNLPENVEAGNQYFKDISFFHSHALPNQKAEAIFVVNWGQLMKKETAEAPENFTVEQVKLNGRAWVKAENGKECKITHIQYVYAPWVDTAEKRKKTDPAKRDKKITQIFVQIEPKEELNDYYRVTVKDAEAKSGEKMEHQESGVVKITGFNKLIKM
jgi:hypothetical protein